MGSTERNNQLRQTPLPIPPTQLPGLDQPRDVGKSRQEGEVWIKPDPFSFQQKLMNDG